MNFELLILLVLCGFAIGVSLVVSIARSLNPIRYPLHNDYRDTRDSGSGGWIPLLVLLCLGYFILQSEFAKDLKGWLAESKPSLKSHESNVARDTLLLQVEKGDAAEHIIETQEQDIMESRLITVAEESGSLSNEDDDSSLDESEFISNDGEVPCFVQTGAFSDIESAYSEQKRWEAKTRRPVYIGTEKDEYPVRFRVLIGTFNSKLTANYFIEENKIDGFVQDSEGLSLQ